MIVDWDRLYPPFARKHPDRADDLRFREAFPCCSNEGNVLITNSEFQTLNRCLDNAIADAVPEFARERDRVIADASEQTLNERLGFLTHEFRNLINTAMLAMNVIKRGNVRIAGSTGAVLDRSLKGLQNLCERVLVDVRLRAGIPQHRERVLVSELVEETQVSAANRCQRTRP
jgi:hypothetical protein